MIVISGILPISAQDSLLLDSIKTDARDIGSVRSLLIEQNDSLLAEFYFNGREPDLPFNIKSASKSIIGLLVGIAINEGFIPSVDEPISTYFPDAKIIVIQRDPCNIFPSTEALQKLLFNIATDIPISNMEKKAIYKILEDFRLNLQLTLVKKKTLPFKVIRFNDLINNRELVLKALLKWMDCENIKIPTSGKTVHKTKALYKPLNKSELIKILTNPWPAWPKETYLKN